VRSAAVDAATRCGGQRAVPVLLAALKDTSWEVRRAAAKALGFIGENSAVPGLCELIQDPDRDVREAGISALGQINDVRALVPLVTALLDVERTVRTLAHATLRKLKKDWEQSPLIAEAVPAVQAALSHPDYWVRYSATQLIEQLKIDVDRFTEQIDVSLAPKVETTPPHVALPFLADLLFDRDRDLRVAAAEALARLRERGAATVLAAAARDADHAVQNAAQAALAALN